MKKTFIFLQLIFLNLLIISCSASQYLDDSEKNYVKYNADSVISSVEWTQEIDGDILLEKIAGSGGFDKKVKANGLNVFLSANDAALEPLYPQLQGFASLDLKKYNDSVLKKLNDFSDTLCNLKFTEKDEPDFSVCERYFAPEKIYSLVIFKYEFGEVFKDKKFLDFLIGEPFLGNDIIQCPVRFFYSESKNYLTDYMDFYIYLKNYSGDWKITQIDFKSMYIKEEAE